MESNRDAVFLQLLCLATMFAENTGRLQVTNMKVPNPFIYSSSTDLFCNYTWDSVEDQRRPRTIYSIKWYKDGEEFFRYVPSEDPQIISFHKDGIFVDESRSSAQVVHLRIVHWNTAGTYRCEVTADDYETVSMTKYSEVVAVPGSNPFVTGQNMRYSLGELVNLNCTSNSSDPAADLFWYINSEAYDTVKAKCTAMLGDVYMKSNEISFKVKAPQNVPALESREKNGKSFNSGGNDFSIVQSDAYSYMLSNEDGSWNVPLTEDKKIRGTGYKHSEDSMSRFGNMFGSPFIPSKGSSFGTNLIVLASLPIFVVASD